MAPIYAVIPNGSAHSDSDSDYEVIRDDESIEVIDDSSSSGVLPDYNSNADNFSSQEEEETTTSDDATKKEEKSDGSEQTIGISYVGTDPKETEPKLAKAVQDIAIPRSSEAPKQAEMEDKFDSDTRRGLEEHSGERTDNSDINANAEENVAQDVENEINRSVANNELIDEGDVAKQLHSEISNNVDDDQKSENLESAQIDDSMASSLPSTDASQAESSEVEFGFDYSSLLDRVTSIPIVEGIYELEEERRIVIQCLESTGVFRSDTSPEYIKIKARTQKRIDQLGFSARIIYANLDIKLYNEGCLMAADDNFLAKVQIVDSNLVRQATSFDETKKVLLQQLRIVHVLQDDLTDDRKTLESSVLNAIQHVLRQSLKDARFAVDCIQLSQMVKSYFGRSNFHSFCEKTMNNKLISQQLRDIVSSFLNAEARSMARVKMLSRFNHCYSTKSNTELFLRLRKMLDEHNTAYKKQLLEKAPICLHKPLCDISNDRILFIQSSDIKLFSDMMGVLNQNLFEKPLADLAARWVNHMKKIKITKLLTVEPQTNPMFYFVAKSLEELIDEISSRTEHAAEDLLTSDRSGWHPIKKITWKSENALTKCLEREYFFIFKLLRHFDLGSGSEKQTFEYTVKLFEGAEEQSTWNRLFTNTKRALGLDAPAGNSLNIDDEKYVWYCLLDDVLYHILPTEYQFDCFENIIHGYIDFLSKAERKQWETLRVITHNTARFIVQTMTYVVQSDQSSNDREILQKQLDLINTKAIQQSLTSNSFRDLVDVFNMYWKNREEIIAGLTSKICVPEMVSMKTALLDIVSVALDKNVTPEVMVSFFRSYSDLLVDLNDIQFDWYIKAPADVSMNSIVDLKIIVPVDNKWANTENKIYRVVATEKFAKTAPVLFDDDLCHKHYILEILQTMLSYIKNQLLKTNWKSGEQLSEMEQIATTNELIFGVRNSFLYLSEQSEYVSFELFFDERIKPFTSAIDNSVSHRDFTNRIYLIKESFWYIRKQNEMAVDQALKLFGELNSDHEIKVLRSAYQKYEECFKQFMELCSEVSEYMPKAAKIANKVLGIVYTKPHRYWNTDDKCETIPELLAGLAAVWSILVSKDVSSTGKYLTPHCIQVLCILRLLSVDRASDGVISHLAQVLTGQGKSLVLGLTASLLALTGHEPRIVCYNEYLVSRDKQDLKQFFDMFKIGDSIVYSTFDGMANSLIEPVVNGKRVGLRTLVEQMIMAKNWTKQGKLYAEDMRKSVLLIDEVDVFFTTDFYGNNYYPSVRFMIQGLDSIQKKIWEFVSVHKIYSIIDIANAIYAFIASKAMKQAKEFHAFISNTKQYEILVRDRMKETRKSYTNKTLFDEQLQIMINNAIQVQTVPANRANYILSSQGTILSLRRGKYVNYFLNEYYPIFNYFRLRGSKFITTVGSEVNFGYLNLGCGAISYAMLPKSYPLILGVSGTVSALNEYEKTSIRDLYALNKTSIMPTYFGGSNLSFSQSHDFRVLASMSEWKAAIFSRANAILGKNRAVLVFFESDLLLNSFRAEYSGQFDRLNVLTENTERPLMSQYIDEAGVAKTITLATSGMGRGVDYKSSVAIEKHGGLHVIQTFFSLDVKEETQIKGRTARKDNRGSYELIICKDQLACAGLATYSQNYPHLHFGRLNRSLEDNRQILDTIKGFEHDHSTTIDYMKSFFKR